MGDIGTYPLEWLDVYCLLTFTDAMVEQVSH